MAEYINEMRVNKDNSSRSNHDAQTQPSANEIQERVDYKRSLDRELSGPKSRFGASSKSQHDEFSLGSRSAGGESDSVWQSLSSASYESNGSSQFQQIPPHTKRSSKEVRM